MLVIEKNKIIEAFSKTKKKKALWLVTTKNKANPDVYQASYKEGAAYFCCSFVVTSSAGAIQVFEALAENLDCVFLDAEEKGLGIDLIQICTERFPNLRFFEIYPNKITADAVFEQVKTYLSPLKQKNVLLLGMGSLGKKIAQRYEDVGVNLWVWNRSKVSTSFAVWDNDDCIFDCVIAATSEKIDDAILNRIKLNQKSLVIDAGNGCFTEKFIAHAWNSGAIVCCGFVGPMITQNLNSISEYGDWRENAGRKTLLNGLNCVTVGLLGNRGDVLVNQLNYPNFAIGVCNGYGDLMYGEEAKPFLEKFNQWLEQEKR